MKNWAATIKGINMDSIHNVFEGMIQDLRLCGFEDAADQVKNVKEAFRAEQYYPAPSRRIKTRVPEYTKQYEPPVKQFDDPRVPGEVEKLEPIDNVIKRFSQPIGIMRMEYMKPTVKTPEGMKSQRDIDAERIYEEKGADFLRDLHREVVRLAANRKRVVDKLKVIQASSMEKGFTTVARRLGEIADKIAATVSSEGHHVISMEDVFEKSNGPNDLLKNLEKAQRVYEGASGLVKLLLYTYKKNPPDTPMKIAELIRKTDALIDKKFDELNRLK